MTCEAAVAPSALLCHCTTAQALGACFDATLRIEEKAGFKP